jgi:hypothetical protein
MDKVQIFALCYFAICMFGFVACVYTEHYFAAILPAIMMVALRIHSVAG